MTGKGKSENTARFGKELKKYLERLNYLQIRLQDWMFLKISWVYHQTLMTLELVLMLNFFLSPCQNWSFLDQKKRPDPNHQDHLGNKNRDTIIANIEYGY